MRAKHETVQRILDLGESAISRGDWRPTANGLEFCHKAFIFEVYTSKVIVRIHVDGESGISLILSGTPKWLYKRLNLCRYKPLLGELEELLDI